MKNFQAFRVEQTDDGFHASWQTLDNESLPEGDVLIEVEYSSLNYKDALSYSGHKGITRHFPHTPGIDAAGRVLESSNPNFKVGQQVIVFGFDLGMNTDGGFSERIRVPAQWVLHKPENLSLSDAMAWGTAGFTAGLSFLKLNQYSLAPDNGPILVTGATGGVGIVGVALLAHLGFDVVAVTGKQEQTDWLKRIGACEVISRDDCLNAGAKPLAKPLYQAAMDTVGGAMLASILSQIKPQGVVSTCGMVAGDRFESSIFPFILRGIHLVGVDSVNISQQEKQALIDKLACDWQLPNLNAFVTEIDRANLQHYLDKLLESGSVGRYRLKL